MQIEEHSHWHILGCGAIGTLIAFKLSRQQLPVTFIGRQNHDKTRQFTDLNNVNHRLVSVARDPIDRLIICTKSTQAVHAFAAIQSRLGPHSLVICLFNGLGAQQAIQSRATNPVFCATTTEGVSKIADGHYGFKGAGETVVDGRILQCLSGDELPSLFTPVDNIDDRLINKLVVNSLINPLTVVFDCKNGELLLNEQAMVTMRALAGEIALWLSTYRQSVSAENLIALAIAVARATEDNTSSMRQDIRNKQPTEIDFINGYWLSHNAKAICLQENARLVAEIKKIESTFT